MMTKEEALENLEYAMSDNCTENLCGFQEEFAIAIECIQHCIDEESNPCYNCTDKHCENCLYNGKL